MLTCQIIGGVEFTLKMQDAPLSVKDELSKAVRRMSMKVLALAKQKVSGEVLKVRTGTLRRKINVRFHEADGLTTGTVGIKLSYAAAHEFGVKKEGRASVNAHAVKAHLRKCKKTGRDSMVRAHARGPFDRNYKLNLPERSFLRAALRDLRPEIERELEAAAGRGIQ